MEKPNDTIAGFDRVDQMANPAFFTQFMDKSHTLQSASIYRQRMFDLLDVGLGATLLDVGCGAGNDVQDLAKQVGPSGRVVGIDSSSDSTNILYNVVNLYNFLVVLSIGNKESCL